MKSQVLVDSEAFKKRFEEVSQLAEKSIYVQAMSFEGDKSGEWLIDCLLKSKAKDIILCLDSYSKFVVNDHFVYSLKYFKDKSFRDEIKNTKTILNKARQHGVKVKYTNPLGFLFLRYPLRNHKKMVVVDEKVSYVGGINFCDHNFEWHDMMIELHDVKIGSSLAEDVRNTFAGNDQSDVFDSKTSKVYFMDGFRSENLYSQIFQNIKEAKKSVQIFSPYVSDPLLSYLRENKPEGVALDVVSPAINNKSVFKKILTAELTAGYFNFLEYQGRMSHLKAILIDGETLIAGSSNFDFVSYYFEQEVVLVTKDTEIVNDFVAKVLKPDIKKCVQLGGASDNVDLTTVKLMKLVGKLSAVVAQLILLKRKLVGKH